MGEKEVDVKRLGQIVACRALKPKAYISLEQCKKCVDFRGIELVMKYSDGKPPIERVSCGLPSGVQIENHLSLEVSHGSTE